MAKTWAEVVGSEGFQAMPDAEKAIAREQYFDQVVAPQVPQEDIGFAREQFFSSTQLVPAAKAQPQAEMKAWEPSALQEILNVGKRGLLQAEQTKNSLAFQAGLMDAATFAEKTRELNRRMGAAAPSGDVAAGLDRLQEANQTGSIGKVASELSKPKNWKALGALVAESAVATAENIPFTVAGAVTGGPGGAAAATGATSFASEFGAAVVDLLEKKGVSLSDPDAIRTALEDPKFMQEARERGLKRGIPVAAFDALSAGFAGNFLRRLEKTAGVLKTAKASGKEAALQIGSGMAGEAVGQIATGESKPLDVFIEGLAELPGGVAEVGGNIRAAQRAQAQEAQAPTPEVTPPVAGAPAPTPAPTVVPPQAEQPTLIPERITQDDLDTRTRQLVETTNIPEEDARIVAKKQLTDEAEILGRIMPRTEAPTNRVETYAQAFIDEGMPQKEAFEKATQVVKEEDEADALAQTEAKGAEDVTRPIPEPSGAGVPVAGQPSEVTPTEGAGVVDGNRVVPTGQDVAGVTAGEAVEPAPIAQEAPVEEVPPTPPTEVVSEAPVQAAPTEVIQEQPPVGAPAPVIQQPAEPKRPRGRPKLAAEQLAQSEAARKQQRLDANQAAKNVTKAEAAFAEAAKPLNEEDFDNEQALAEAQGEQRQKRGAALRTLYQISRENRNKPGQRAAEILKTANPREVADAKAAYEYAKSKGPSANVAATAPADANFSKAKNGAQALTYIVKSGSAFERLVAARIRPFVGGVKFVVLENTDPTPKELQSGRNAEAWARARGVYIQNDETKTRTVYVRGASFGDDQGTNTVTVLHELLHAATNQKIALGMLASANGFSTDAKITRFVEELNGLALFAQDVYKYSVANKVPLPAELRSIVEATKTTDPDTGEVSYEIFSKPQEFVAYGMSDPQFQEFLKRLPGRRESGFSRFVQLILDLFNLGKDKLTAFTDLVDITDKLLSARKTPMMRFVEKGLPSEPSMQAKGTDEEEAVRSAKEIRSAVSKALHKTAMSRTAEEYASSISTLHALKDPSLIIPLLKKAWDYADDKSKNIMAGTPTFDFLARWTEKTVPELTNTNKLLEQMSGMSHQLLTKVGHMSEDMVRAYKRSPSMRVKLENLVYTSTLAQIDPSNPLAKERDARLDKMYKELGSDGQRIYKMLRDYYRAMTEYYSSLLDKQIEDLDINDDTKKNLLAAVKTIYEGKQKIAPYFPLVRRGDFWLGVGSGETRQFYMFETKAERDNVAQALAAEKRTSLEELLDEKKFSIGDDIDKLRQASYQSSGLLRQIFDAIDSSNLTDPEARESLKDAIYQIYLQAMPDQSFRRQFIHRKGISGFSTDLLRNVNTSGVKMSVQLARIKYGPLLRNSVAQARESIQATPEYEPFVNSASNRVTAALTAGRKGGSVDRVLEGVAGAANKASYIWYLSGAASALIQPFSVYITGLPILTAKHGPKAAKELAKMVTYINQYGIIRQNADGTRSYVAPSIANNKDLSPDERRAVRDMMDRDVTQSSYASEVFGYKSTPSEQLYFDPSRGVIDNIPVAYGKGKQLANVIIGGLMHNTERLSREAIYLASYRLSRSDKKTHEQAVDQAVMDTNEALGNYNITNRPLLMQKPGGKVLLQFQMFPLHTTLLLLTNLKRMMPLLNKEGKAEAATKFFGILGTAFSVAGLVGVPGFSAIMGLLGWAWKEMGKDDDWPEDLKSMDFELWFRTVFLPKNLGEDMAALAEYGPLNKLTGLDFATRLSLNNLWGRDTKETKTTREGIIASAVSHAGPTATMILSLADAWDAWGKGDTKRAVEKMSPAVVRNVAIWKHMRESGVQDYKGSQLMSPEAIKTGELFGQMIGFRPALSADIQDKNFRFLGIENRINNERDQILTRLDNAYRNKDMKAYRKAHEEMIDFNKGFPSYAIEPDDLTASLEKRQEQRGKSYLGVTPTEKNVPLFEESLVRSRKQIQKREKEMREK